MIIRKEKFKKIVKLLIPEIPAKNIEMRFVVKDRKKKIWWPSKEAKKIAFVNKNIYKKAEKNPIKFWEKFGEEIEWMKKWKKVYEEKFPYFKWFVGGKLNASINCLDRHLKDKAERPAIIWVPETKEKQKIFTYSSLYEQVNRAANILLSFGIKKGDVVAIYLPMIPETIISMLACARIGAIHNVVFSAFSPEALRTRLIDCGARLLITANGYYRRGKIINLKENANEATKNTKVKNMLVVERIKERGRGKDFFWEEEIKHTKNFCNPERMDSEDILFILYTSGTTGIPKGVIHTTAGYLVQAYLTGKWDFNFRDNINWCTADIGWITGHTYVCYSPLLNGITTLIYEGAPDFPDPGRTWKIIEENKVNVFYTAPTALRMFMSYGEKWPKKYNLDSLSILGTVGEPIDEETWLWYFNVIGKKKLPIIDTWWQTETGGALINSLPGVGPFIPTVAGKSFPGTRHEIVDEKGKKAKRGMLVQLSPFAPGMLRGIWKNPKRYKEYWMKKMNKKMYITKDSAFYVGKNFRLSGRIDDIIKVAGHRLSTAELENVLDKYEAVLESAVVSRPNKIKGEVPVAFVVLKKNFSPSEKLKTELIKEVEKKISPIARPYEIYFVSDLPKTRSGKIIRRILKALLRKEAIGDVSTLLNPKCVEELKKLF